VVKKAIVTPLCPTRHTPEKYLAFSYFLSSNITNPSSQEKLEAKSLQQHGDTYETQL
jgi:hypothetical protein